MFLQKIANMESTTKGAQSQSNAASQEKYISGNHTITCFTVAKHAAFFFVFFLLKFSASKQL